MLEGSGGWRVAALGSELSGDVVHFDVPDLAVISEYSVSAIGVSDTDNELVSDSDAYEVVLEVRR